MNPEEQAREQIGALQAALGRMGDVEDSEPSEPIVLAPGGIVCDHCDAGLESGAEAEQMRWLAAHNCPNNG